MNTTKYTLSKVFALILLPALSLLLLSCDKQQIRESYLRLKALSRIPRHTACPVLIPARISHPSIFLPREPKKKMMMINISLLSISRMKLPLLKIWGTRYSLILNRVVPLSLAASPIPLNKCTSIRHRNILLMASLFQWNCTLSARLKIQLRRTIW